MMEAEQPDLQRIRQAIGLAAQQTLRSGEIIRRLRAFVSRGEVVRQPEAVSKLIEEASALALVGAKERSVTVRIDGGQALPPVQVDRVQVQQVLLNLIRNAVDAMEGMPKRMLSIDATLWDSMVAIAVADTGTGIAPAIEAQLFQPFVTTKREGMGIGLSVCRTIVEAHGGRLWAEPNPAGGTIFHFTLPLAQSE
jgi:two-component system sensor kinase FixL